MSTFGFIGVGNMGGALAEAVCRKYPPEKIFLSNRTAAKADILAKKLGCHISDNESIASACRYIFLGVKPQTLPPLLAGLRPIFKNRKEKGERFSLISMAAGVSLDHISKMLGFDLPVIRIMPNIPVSVGAGMILYAANKHVLQNELKEFESALNAAGKTEYIHESEMDAASILSGCAPAYIFLFMKAMIDAGTTLGLSKEKASLYTEQTMLGAAKLALTTQQDPELLKAAVCSPGGTTIEGINVFENAGFSSIVSAAVNASYQKTLRLAGKSTESEKK